MTTITNRYVAGWAVLAYLPLGGGSVAHGKVLALESHSSPRTEQTARMVATVIGSLGNDVLSGKALSRKMTQVYGRLPLPLPPERLAKLQASLKQGAAAKYIGEWDKAIKLLLPVEQELARSILSISRSKALFETLQRTRLWLAECYKRSKRPKLAQSIIAEVLRAQPNISVSLIEYHPILVRLFLKVKNALDRQQTSLIVTSDPKGSVVFLGGRYVGLSPVKFAKIYPGRYDLLVVKDNKPSRIQRTTVRGSHQVRVDLALHNAIASKRFAGLQIDEGPGRDTLEMRFAMDIATRVGASKIVLIGRRRIRAGRCWWAKRSR